MLNLIRTSYFGRLVYKLSHYRYFTYPEEQADYEIPEEYLEIKTGQQLILDWDSSDDQHPKNWSRFEKFVCQAQMVLLSFVMYMGGPIYTPAIPAIMEEFNIEYVYSTFPLCFYIVGYGITQLFFSPMSEQPNIGRTPIYFYTGILVFILQIPCALSSNITGLTLSRFFSGLFASPALSVGAGTCADVTKLSYIPVVLAFWAFAAFCGPSIGPIIGVALLQKHWSYIFWFLMALVGGVTLILFVFLPETHDNSLLLWKAQRLRRITGNSNIVARCELGDDSLGNVLVEILRRCFEIILKEPRVLLMDLYQGACYGVLYLWFESFPVAYEGTYHFSTAAMALAFNAINVGVLMGMGIYLSILYPFFIKRLINGQPVSADIFLATSLIGSIFVTISLFVFGWTVSPKIHWFPSLIAATCFGIGSFCVLQSNLNYLGMIYPRFVASVFGGNGLFRSLIGGSFPIYGKQMFENLSIPNFPVAWGSTLLGIIFLVMCLIPILFRVFDSRLQRNSRFVN